MALGLSSPARPHMTSQVADPDQGSGRAALGLLRQLPCVCETDRAGAGCHFIAPQAVPLSPIARLRLRQRFAARHAHQAGS
jgi:hypothetical protein